MCDRALLEERMVSCLEEGVRSGTFPGGQFVVVEKGEVVCRACAGEVSPGKGAVTPETVYDLASLTKPLSGLWLVASLVSKGLLDLDAPVSRYVPDFKTSPSRDVTLDQLLSHTSGLPSWEPYYVTLMAAPETDRRHLLKSLLHDTPLRKRPGIERCYSDVGFMLVKEVVEAVSGVGVRLLYNDLLDLIASEGGPVYAVDLPSGSQVAPTEACPWRGVTLKGVVHDDNAWAMGGEALHAGLFGSATSVALRVWGLFDAAQERPEGYGSGVSQVLQRSLYGKRALGVDRPSGLVSASGRLFSPGSWGHLGFTGTSFWVDPVRTMVVVLLTNRVHPSRENINIRDFRPRIHDLYMEARYSMSLVNR